MTYSYSIRSATYRFNDLKDLLAKASPARSGDYLAGVAAASAVERMAAKMCLADLSLKTFLSEAVIPYETDEVTRLIMDRHDAEAFAEISHLNVGDFRNWLLADGTDAATLARVASGITPEMAAAVSKLMRNQDLILVAKKWALLQKNKKRGALLYFSGQIVNVRFQMASFPWGDDSGLCPVVL